MMNFVKRGYFQPACHIPYLPIFFVIIPHSTFFVPRAGLNNVGHQLAFQFSSASGQSNLEHEEMKNENGD